MVRRTSALPKVRSFRAVKQKPTVEIVQTCDQCGNRLVSSCIRTVGSAICAAGDGASIREINGVWRIFCCPECRTRYEA